MEFVSDLHLLIKFLFQLIFLVFLPNFYFLESFDPLFLDYAHLKFVPADKVLDISLLFLELFGLLLQFF